MIKIEKTQVWGFEHAVRGMRNPMNSHHRSDSYYCSMKPCETNPCKIFKTPNPDCLKFVLGENDLDLAKRLIRGGQPHRKFLRQIMVSVDITAPMYWWKEFDTYKVGTTANSTSTMHKIHAKEFTLSDFSCEDLFDDEEVMLVGLSSMKRTIADLNTARELFLQTKDKKYWRTMIQLLPSSYNQTRTVTMTYENLINMLEYRRGHKLVEWRVMCEWITSLPYGSLLMEGVTNEQS